MWQSDWNDLHDLSDLRDSRDLDDVSYQCDQSEQHDQRDLQGRPRYIARYALQRYVTVTLIRPGRQYKYEQNTH